MSDTSFSDSEDDFLPKKKGLSSSQNSESKIRQTSRRASRAEVVYIESSNSEAGESDDSEEKPKGRGSAKKATQPVSGRKRGVSSNPNKTEKPKKSPAKTTKPRANPPKKAKKQTKFIEDSDEDEEDSEEIDDGSSDGGSDDEDDSVFSAESADKKAKPKAKKTPNKTAATAIKAKAPAPKRAKKGLKSLDTDEDEDDDDDDSDFGAKPAPKRKSAASRPKPAAKKSKPVSDSKSSDEDDSDEDDDLDESDTSEDDDLFDSEDSDFQTSAKKKGVSPAKPKASSPKRIPSNSSAKGVSKRAPSAAAAPNHQKEPPAKKPVAKADSGLSATQTAPFSLTPEDDIVVDFVNLAADGKPAVKRIPGRNISSDIPQTLSQEVPEETSAAPVKSAVKLASNMPLTLPKTMRTGRTTALVQIEEPGFDLSGDIGAIGRLTVLPREGIILDLKGHQYAGTIAPSCTFMVVGFGPTEAKVECIVNDFVQLDHLSNVLESLSGKLESGEIDPALLTLEDVDGDGEAQAILRARADDSDEEGVPGNKGPAADDDGSVFSEEEAGPKKKGKKADGKVYGRTVKVGKKKSKASKPKSKAGKGTKGTKAAKKVKK